MMQWIDTYAVPLLVLLLIAAAGGFFVHERWRLPAYPAGAPAHAPRWLALGVLASLAMGGMTWSVEMGAQPAATSTTASCLLCVNWMALDHQVQAWVQTQGAAPWMPLVRAFTQLGHVGWMAALGVATCAWLVYRRAWVLAGAWVLGVAGVGLWIRILKHLVGRARPDVRWAMEQGYSFPSGHSAGTLLCYGLLAWVFLVLARPAHGRWVIALTALVVLGVGMSRILLGVHYVSDVLAGWLLGLAWLGVVVGLAEVARQRAVQRAWA